MPSVGLGLRAQHFDAVLERRPKLSCFEVLSDNYLHGDSPALDKLEQIRADYTFIAHGVGLSIGSADPLNFDYLKRIRTFLERLQIQHYSDHLCFVSSGNIYVPELLPLILNEASLNYLIARVQLVQDFLGRPLILENISQYVQASASDLSDLEFLNLLCQHTGAKILLDVNNLWVNACNHQLSLNKILTQIDAQYIAYMHLGGYEQFERIPSLLVDTHGAEVQQGVWDFYARVLQRTGSKLTIIERDQNLPAFAHLLQEAALAAKMQGQAGLTIGAPSEIINENLLCDAPFDLQNYQKHFIAAIADPNYQTHQTLFKNFDGMAFDVYRSSIFTSLEACIKKIYKPLHALIGEACFTALAREFVRTNFPHDPVLDLYGEDFSEFVQHHALNEKLPYLADYVKFLWFLHKSFLATPSSMTLNSFDLDHPENLEIFSEPLNLMQSVYPIYLIHEACLKEATAPIEMIPNDYYFCFLKQRHGLKPYSLLRSQHWLLTLLSKLSNFMLVCEHYLEHFDAAGFISDIEFLARQQLITIKEKS